MNKQDRFNQLQHEIVDKKIYEYLASFFNELNIEILGDYQGALFELMEKGVLEGWCFQTTETAALFMSDDTIIHRGILMFDKDESYYHAFIEFTYDNKEYIFDPCLGFINSKELYFDIFNIHIRGSVTAKDIKEYFINYYYNPPAPKYYCDATEKALKRFMEKYFGEYKTVPQVVIHDEENPSAPMYRNGSGYRDLIMNNNKIKSLTVHYYLDA